MASRAAIYIRVSTQEQERGYSLTGQYTDCRNYAERHGYQVVRRYQDVASGRTLDRPGFQGAIEAAIRETYDVLIVWRRDRFGRDSVHNGVFDRLLDHHQVRIETVQGGPREPTAYTTFMDRISDAVDELEAAKITERCQMGRESAARAGIWPTKPMHGYRRTHRKGPLEPIPHLALRVVQLYEEIAAGRSLRIAAHRAGCHHSTAIYRVRNPAYKGQAVYAGVQIAVPALVSEDLWTTANRRLDEAAQALGRRVSKGRDRSTKRRRATADTKSLP